MPESLGRINAGSLDESMRMTFWPVGVVAVIDVKAEELLTDTESTVMVASGCSPGAAAADSATCIASSPKRSGEPAPFAMCPVASEAIRLITYDLVAA